jgi:hypothetical protein
MPNAQENMDFRILKIPAKIIFIVSSLLKLNNYNVDGRSIWAIIYLYKMGFLILNASHIPDLGSRSNYTHELGSKSQEGSQEGTGIQHGTSASRRSLCDFKIIFAVRQALNLSCNKGRADINPY